jgi:effector-binding domain-containing protein
MDLVEIEPTRYAVKSGSCGHHEIGQLLGQLFNEVAQGVGDTPVGVPVAIYTAWNETTCDILAGFSVPDGTTIEGLITFDMEGLTAAHTTHNGPYQNMMATWNQLWADFSAAGMQAGGPPWEEYVVGMQETSDPSQLVTDIYIPLAKL